MAKLSEILKDLGKRLGAVIDDEALDSVKEIEVSETVFEPFFNNYIDNFGRNRSKSVHQLYEQKLSALNKLKDILGDDKLTKIQQQQGEKKLDALESALEEAFKDLKDAKKDADPTATKEATDRINELQRSLNELQTKYEGYVSKDDFNKVVSEKDKRLFDEQLLRRFEKSDLADEFKKSDRRLAMKVVDFYDIVEKNNLVIDFKSGKVTKEDGTEAHRGRQAITLDTLLIEAIGDDKKVGEPIPASGQRTVTSTSKADSLQAYADKVYNN